MYSIDWSRILPAGRKGRGIRSGGKVVVSGTVWALGFTSLLTDISSEMVSSILPIYLVTHLGMSPLMFGVVDGLQQGAAAIVRLAGGVLADRWRRHKAVAATGYLLSAACRILLLPAGAAWTAIMAIIAMDRVGKGIRTAPRDALIAQSSEPSHLGTAFGVHRALDAAGALLGPVAAFALLLAWPGAYDIVFAGSFATALLGVAVILLFVPGAPPVKPDESLRPAVTFRTAMGLPREKPLQRLMLSGAVLGLATISDSFLFLQLQQKAGLAAMAFPLLYVGTSLVTALLAVPCGRAADAWGRGRILLAGYAALGMVYALVLLMPGQSPWWALVPALGGLGFHYAATDGILAAMGAKVIPRDHAGSGLALLATAVSAGRLLASVGFGWLWSRWGASAAISIYLPLLATAVGISVFLLRHVPGSRERPAEARV